MRTRMPRQQRRAARWHANPDHLSGGRSEGHTEDEFDPRQLRVGEQHELEHTRDRKVARQIAMDHLIGMPDYYTWLRAMEILADREKKQGVHHNPESPAERLARLVRDQEIYYKIAKETVRRALYRELSLVYAGKSASRAFSMTEMDQFANQVLGSWAAEAAERNGLAVRVEGRQLIDLGHLILRDGKHSIHPDVADRLFNSLRKPMAEFKSDLRGWVRRAVPMDPSGRMVTSQGSGTDVQESEPEVYSEILGEALSLPSVERKERLDEAVRSVMGEYIEQLGQQPDGDIKQEIIALHTSYATEGGQTLPAWATKRTGRGKETVVLADIRRFHHHGEACPTCNRIARQLNSPTIGVQDVRLFVDAFLRAARRSIVAEMSRKHAHRAEGRDDLHQSSGEGAVRDRSRTRHSRENSAENGSRKSRY